MKALVIISIMGVTLMADCTVVLKKQYDVNVDSMALIKPAMDCLKTVGVTTGCVKKEKNTYTLQDTMVCIFNDGNNAVGIPLYPGMTPNL